MPPPRIDDATRNKLEQEWIVNKRLPVFRDQMMSLFENFIENLGSLTNFELDLRNWHGLLRMKEFKPALENIRKSNTEHKSMISQSYKKTIE